MMGFYLLIGVISLASWAISNTLKNKFKKYSQIQLRNGMSGAEIASKMLADHGISDVTVISTPGMLTDHYNPQNKTVNLSEGVYNQRNAAAAAVAAHEVGHAVQHARAYQWLQHAFSISSHCKYHFQVLSMVGYWRNHFRSCFWRNRRWILYCCCGINFYGLCHLI